MRYLVPLCLALMIALAAIGDIRRSLLLPGAPAAAAVAPDILIGFETGSDGDAWKSNAAPAALTSAIEIGASTFIWPEVGSNNAARDSNTLLRVSTTQAKRGTRSFRAHCTNATVGDWIEFTLATNLAKVSWCYWFRVDTAWDGNDFGSHDMRRFYSTNGDYFIDNLDSQPAALGIGAHCPSDVGTPVYIPTNTWVNVQGIWDSNTMGCIVRVYTNSTQFAQSSNNLPNAVGMGRLQFGHVDGHTKRIAGFAYFDDIEIYTNGPKGTPFPITPTTGL